MRIAECGKYLIRVLFLILYSALRTLHSAFLKASIP